MDLSSLEQDTYEEGVGKRCNETYTTTEKNVILIIAGSVAATSICMCMIAVSFVVCLKLYKVFTYRLAMYQVLAGMMYSFSDMLLPALINYNSSILAYVIVCKAQAFLVSYLLWVKLLFTVTLIFHLLCLAVFMKNFKKLELFYVLFPTLFPLSFTWVPFIHDNYDIAGAWCWIRDWKDNCASHRYLEGIIEQFALWFGPLFVFLIISVLIAIIIFIVLLWRLCKILPDESQPLLENNLKQRQKKMLWDLLPLLAYPIIFSIISLVPIINRVYNAISHSPSFELSVIHIVILHSMGFFSGTALIAHVLVVKLYKQRSSQRKTEADPSRVVNVTTSGTAFLIPAESEIDKLFGNVTDQQNE